MNVTGIIAEYKPLHNGHLYQLEKARNDTNAAYLIVVMSGDFVQRGAPALIDKYTRAKMALENGADLVLELPVLWSTASAEYFAGAGIALLDRIGVTSAVCFGCETPDQAALLSLARFLAEEPSTYRSALNDALKKGMSYPAARAFAVQTSLSASLSGDPSVFASVTPELAETILASPNNILGLEYCKSLFRRNSQIRPVPIARIGSGYHANDLDTSFASATGIRSYLNGLADLYSDLSALEAWMPESAFLTLCEALNTHPLMFEEDFAAMLGYCLATHDSFADYADGSLDLSNRILRQREHFSSVADFLEDLKTKEVTYTRLSRLLTHILLDIKEKDYGFYRNLDYVPYGKILGFREDAAPLLKELKQHSTIPLLTSPLDKKQQLDEATQALLKKDVLASELYRMAAVQKSGFAIPNEYKRKFLRV